MARPSASARAVRGVGLTPRLFKELVDTPGAAIDAAPAGYVPVITRHVQSILPSPNVMAQNFVPVVMEDEVGVRRVLHVDPLAVRKFRRSIAEELKNVQAKRQLMLGRIQSIRQQIPKARSKDIAACMEHEIACAETKIPECLVQKLSAHCLSLYILIEATPSMIQLKLVCDHLMRELPVVFDAGGVQTVSLAALGIEKPRRGHGEIFPSQLDCVEPAAALEWLYNLGSLQQEPPQAASPRGRKGATPADAGSEVAWGKALRRAATANSMSGGCGAVLLIACSPPTDLDAGIAVVRRSDMIVQVVGVFGSAPEDPEPAMQALTDAAAEGSEFHLFFGAEYWTKFVAARRRQLVRVQEQAKVEERTSGVKQEIEDFDIVDPKIFEMRLIERVMRECYVQERMCEDELQCASKVLDRTLVDPEDIMAALQVQLPRLEKLPSAKPEKLPSARSEKLPCVWSEKTQLQRLERSLSAR